METTTEDTALEAQVDVPQGPQSVLISPEEFADDLELRLGRANGNVFQRKPGMEGVHDGQIMVRLKKKRFIVIDYGVVPTESDIQSAALNPHVCTPDGAGKQKCITPECTKIGVPVLMYDSEPGEPASLYMRSGLCFTCQRILNEKRRTQRKRKSDTVDPTQAGQSPHGAYALGPKKFKMNGEIMELSSDAIIINGPVDGAKVQGEGYGFQEIGADLQSILRVTTSDADRLISSVTASTTGTTENTNSLAFAAAAATAAAVAAAGETAEGSGQVNEDAVSAANAAVEASTSLLDASAPAQETAAPEPASAPAMSSEDIAALYDKAFMSMSKAIFLLSQWKASWDAAIAAAVAQETVGDPGLADAVASAVAVAASSQSDVQDQSTTNMIPLLLAADAKGENGMDPIKKENGEQVQPPQAPPPQNPGNANAGGGATDVQVFGV